MNWEVPGRNGRTNKTNAQCLSSKGIMYDVLTHLYKSGWVVKHREFSFDTCFNHSQETEKEIPPYAAKIARVVGRVAVR